MPRLLSIPVVVALVLTAASAQGASPQLTGRLVYSSDRGPNERNFEISAVSVSGAAAHDLTRNQGYDVGASLSPSGRRVAFWSERISGGRVVQGLFTMRL